MSISERSEGNHFLLPVVDEDTLLAIVAIGFCLLHVLTAVRFSPSASATAAPTL